MSNPEWCKNVGCNQYESFCISKECKDYNPKMTFFEAWEKAKEGDKIYNNLCWEGSKNGWVLKDEKGDLVYFTSRNPPQKNQINKKTWTIIPKKKTVTISIPNDGKNYTVYNKKGTKLVFPDDVSRITCEV